MGIAEDLIEQFAAQEFFIDGFTDHQIVNGIFSCVGYRLHRAPHKGGKMLKVVAMRLVMPLHAVFEANRLTREALDSNPFEGLITTERMGRH